MECANLSGSSIDVILPLYRTEQFAAELISRLADTLRSSRLTIIGVNDASPDQSAAAIKSASSQLGLPCRIIDLMKNQGQHQAVLHGLRDSAAQFSVVMDADLQDPPEAVPALLCEIEHDRPGISFGHRSGAYAGRLDAWTSTAFKWLLFRRLGSDKATGVGMFFALSAVSRKRLLQLPATDGYLPAMLLALHHPVHLTSYQRQTAGRSSGYSLRTRIRLARRAHRWIRHYEAWTNE